MPEQLIVKVIKSPAWFFAVCFALWFAVHSFFAFLFVSFVVASWIKRSMKASFKHDKAEDVKAAEAVAASTASTQEKVTPIKRQYEKSAVVVPIKTGTDD